MHWDSVTPSPRFYVLRGKLVGIETHISTIISVYADLVILAGHLLARVLKVHLLPSYVPLMKLKLELVLQQSVRDIHGGRMYLLFFYLVVTYLLGGICIVNSE